MMIVLPPLAPLLLYRDVHIAVLNKPPGFLVHPVAADSLSLMDGLDALKDEQGNVPLPMHRLDRETSGCLLLGYTTAARRRFEQLFRHQRVAKTYWALVEGQPPAAEGVIELPLRKHQPSRRMVGDETAPPAITHYKVRARKEGLSWLELHPKTGRTHQLRAHCRALGCPIRGDALYQDVAVTGPLQLHAQQIAFPQLSGETLTISAPPPPHMAALLGTLGES